MTERETRRDRGAESRTEASNCIQRLRSETGTETSEIGRERERETARD